MAITLLESGSNATFGTHAWSLGGGSTVSSSTDVTFTGPRVLKIHSGSFVLTILPTSTSAGRLTFYFRTTGTWGAQSRMCLIEGNIIRFALELSTANVLQIHDGSGGGAQIGSNGSTLAANTSYRISVGWNLSDSVSTTFNIQVYVNGVLDISAIDAGTLNSASVPHRLIIGDVDGAGSTDNYIGNIYADEATDSSDPGDIRITAKLPASNSTNAWNTNIGANPANRWENVNERPLSETNGWEETALAAVEESYGIEASSAGDVDLTGATIVGFGTWVWAKGGAGGLGAPKIVHNGADVAVALTSSPAYYATYTTSATYPAGVIGMKSAGVLDTTFLYETGVVVAYTPATGGPDFTFIKPWMIA